MNDQDRDLILALAAGQLAGAEAESAATRIASDPELSRELAPLGEPLCVVDVAAPKRPPFDLAECEHIDVLTLEHGKELLERSRRMGQEVPPADARVLSIPLCDSYAVLDVHRSDAQQHPQSVNDEHPTPDMMAGNESPGRANEGH